MSTLYQLHQVVAAAEPAFGAYRPSALQALLLALAHIPPFHRGIVRRRVANLIRSLGRDGKVDIFHNGASYRIRTNTNLTEDALLVHPRYDRAEIDFLLDGMPEGGGMIDLGANVGLYTLPLALKAGPGGRVLAIEANPDIAEALTFNIEASDLRNVSVACVAAGAAEGMARLRITHADLAIVKIEEVADGAIPVRPLLSIVQEAGMTRVDVLKADIEGFEDRAILPYLESAPRDMHPRRMVVEHLGRKSWQTDCFEAFKQYGFKVVQTLRKNTLFERKDG